MLLSKRAQMIVCFLCLLWRTSIGLSEQGYQSEQERVDELEEDGGVPNAGIDQEFELEMQSIERLENESQLMGSIVIKHGVGLELEFAHASDEEHFLALYGGYYEAGLVNPLERQNEGFDGIRTLSVGLEGQAFVSSSLFFSAGLELSKKTFEDSIQVLTDTNGLQEKQVNFQGSSLLAGCVMSVGSRWQRDRINYGIKWLVLQLPFLVTNERSKVSDGLGNSFDIPRLRRQMDMGRLARNPTIGASIEFGFSF